MERLILIFEMIGTISFALAGAMTGLKKEMDLFGVCVLGVTTAVGGGIIRDLILGQTPPAAFREPTSVLVAILVSIIVFFPAVRRLFYRNKRLYEHVLLLADSAGLGIFTVCGARVAMEAGDGANRFLVIFVAALTGVGGGVLRDLLLGLTPPATFLDPKYVLMSIVTSLFVFSPVVRRVLFHSRKLYDALMLISDSAGLGIFTVYGARVAIGAGYEENLFLVLFVAVITGVGGGVMRDLFAGDRPYIFVKHVYACSALLGALVCVYLWPLAGRDIAMLAGFVLVFAMRLCSAHFRWSLPHARRLAEEEEKTS